MSFMKEYKNSFSSLTVRGFVRDAAAVRPRVSRRGSPWSCDAWRVAEAETDDAVAAPDSDCTSLWLGAAAP